MPDPDLATSGGGGGGHPDPEIRGVSKKFGGPFKPLYCLKIGGLSPGSAAELIQCCEVLQSGKLTLTLNLDKYVVVDFLSQVIFVFLLFWRMVSLTDKRQKNYLR